MARMQKHRGGEIRWLILLILIAGAICSFWRHDHFKKIVPAKITISKSQPKPLIISQQSPKDFPRPVHDIFEAQVALARRGISSGSIDAALGSQTREAISVFQQIENLPQSGKLDSETRDKLTLDSPILTNYIVTTNDLASLQPLGKTWLEKSQQSTLAYETELELVAEKGHSHPLLIQKLNPNVNWTNIFAGTILKIPDVNYPEPSGKAAFVEIHLD